LYLSDTKNKHYRHKVFTSRVLRKPEEFQIVIHAAFVTPSGRAELKF